jgi:hypothetical protein
MKALRVLSFILMGFGLLLVIIGAIFKIQHWPNMFHSLIIGPIIEIIGVVMFILTVIIKRT